MTSPLVLMEDEHFIAVLKPGGMPAQPDRSGSSSILDVLNAGRSSPLLLTHRLDRPVSGAMMLAKNVQAAGALNELFRTGAVGKMYWAIVEGHVAADAEWRHRLLEDKRARKARVTKGDHDDGHEAFTRMRVLARGERYSLIELKPAGGRFHQLRAQCAASGHPIKGDVKYGARRGEAERTIGLHARSISFAHPFTHAPLTICAPPPSSTPWGALLDLAGIDVRSS